MFDFYIAYVFHFVWKLSFELWKFHNAEILDLITSSRQGFSVTSITVVKKICLFFSA